MKNATHRSEKPLPKGRKKNSQRAEVAERPAVIATKSVPQGGNPPETSRELWMRVAVGAIVLAAGVWAYYPTLKEMVTAWEKEPDYSHGFLVLPMSLLFLWLKRSTPRRNRSRLWGFMGSGSRSSWWGSAPHGWSPSR